MLHTQLAITMFTVALSSAMHETFTLNFDTKDCRFGLSRDLREDSYYISHGGKIPVKWTAPEALNYRRYSTASDVWSFGCLLYEIWALGIKPFCDLTNKEVEDDTCL